MIEQLDSFVALANIWSKQNPFIIAGIVFLIGIYIPSSVLANIGVYLAKGTKVFIYYINEIVLKVLGKPGEKKLDEIERAFIEEMNKKNETNRP